MTEIEFNIENLQKCQCPKCMVQDKSECAQKGFKMLPQIIEEMNKGNMPNPKEIPGIYCATGTTLCKDLNYDETCNCINCQIYFENKLNEKEPGQYYCQNGKTE
ncbi:MAG: DUF2769 domain-containing protein [Methanobrevibacter arboriphilus]|jgi:hypothetical protein|uniref:DUF2769 domain-containing protein n=2 Tax=Methanobrevibacter arboriphilus TaxID=39441 RepID=A0A843AEL2_METAZ|nr:hypothetical protein [Methanobrevibacter arboriphilus]MBF4468363.1 DUF2769 domain-containing protein [Methanobrevibacter arboriphilus]MCC7561305.1 DUF2769 domain-containing protein [Methanobrevibacter arboriphilus]BBL62089.1 hypothetical protein MarbSA_11290 [Methanobrevibacter arboriphilus]GLI11879.1 hypothetical protein MARBORIA2_09690 [Methanobrevibacter arboriphilus]